MSNTPNSGFASLKLLQILLHAFDAEQVATQRDAESMWQVTPAVVRNLLGTDCIPSSGNGNGTRLQITSKGKRLCERLLREFCHLICGPCAPTPHWNPAARELSFRGVIVKRFRKSAPNQERLLDGFQSCGWPHRIEDPLIHDFDVLPAHRLHDTIKQLNRTITEPLLHFRTDGTGHGACWESVANSD